MLISRFGTSGPTDYGFDKSLTNFEGMGAKLLPLTKDPQGKVGKIWADAERLGGPVTWMQRSEITSGYIDAAIGFMEKARAAGQPFYVNVWPDDVHSPFWPPMAKWGDGSKRRLYLSVLEEMDKQFGKLFDDVRGHEDLRNNTVILICSDNGCEKGAGQAGPLRGYKTQLYEGGIRSSLIVWAPGFTAADAVGTRNKKSVFAAIDFVPSLPALTGAKPPENANFDGENMLDTILGKSSVSRKPPIFFSRPPDRKDFYGKKNLPDLAIRQGQWKFLCDYDGSRPQLYNILKDVGESNNIAHDHPEIVKKLTEKLVAWYQSMPKLK